MHTEIPLYVLVHKVMWLHTACIDPSYTVHTRDALTSGV